LKEQIPTVTSNDQILLAIEEIKQQLKKKKKHKPPKKQLETDEDQP
jgi:hypothetical protein